MKSHLSLVLSATLFAPLAHAQLAVTFVTPERNDVDAPRNVQIAMAFAQPLAPATVHAGTFRVFGRWSGVMTGTLALRSGGREIEFSPDRPFFPGEWVSVSAAAGITAATGGATLIGGHAFGFWTAASAAGLQFTNAGSFSTRLPGNPAVRTYGGYAGDLDRDGAPDLSLANEGTNDIRVFKNDRCGGFITQPIVNALPFGSIPSPSEGADLNGDGWIDLVVGCHGSGEVAVLLGDGAGGYAAATTLSNGIDTRGVAVLDVEGDGDDDIVAADSSAGQLSIHLNHGNGTFAPATTLNGGVQERAVAVGDANSDGWMDLFVADFSGAVNLLLADGAGGFQQSASVAVPTAPWMIVTGDVDNDGDVDAVTVNSLNWTVSVVKGDGAGGLSPAVNYNVGVFPIAVDLGDLNADGVLDMTVSNFGSANFSVWRGGAGGVFTWHANLPSTSAGSCTLLVDYNRDGYLDIVGIDEVADCVHLFPQVRPPVAGVQPPDCGATLRLDSVANLAGFGASPPHPARLESTLFLGVSGPPNSLFAILLGTRLEPGLASPFGVFNLGGSGVVLVPSGTLDPRGEALVAIVIPPTVIPSQTFTFQAAVVDPAPLGILFSNPEEIVIRP